MPRWSGDARQRLQEEALRLFVERGYASTTVDEVAAAAGVTQRTFFRHFRDKEEVLFGEEQALLASLVAGIAAAPQADDGEEDAGRTMRHVLHGMAEAMEPRAVELRARAAVIASDVALTGRELAKQVRWREAIAAALRGRGYAPDSAELLAAVGFAVFRHALDGWLVDLDGPGLCARVERGLAELARLQPGGD